MLNRVSVMGRMFEDPEVRVVKNGAKSCNFGIICECDDTPEGRKLGFGFFRVQAWEEIAEAVGENFTKDSEIVIDGRLQSSSYIDKNGKKCYSLQIVAESVYPVKHKSKGDKAPEDDEEPEIDEASETDNNSFDPEEDTKEHVAEPLTLDDDFEMPF